MVQQALPSVLEKKEKLAEAVEPTLREVGELLKPALHNAEQVTDQALRRVGSALSDLFKTPSPTSHHRRKKKRHL